MQGCFILHVILISEKGKQMFLLFSLNVNKKDESDECLCFTGVSQ